MSYNDQHILIELNNNNPKPFEEYFRQVFPELVKYAYSLTLSKETAEEIAQDAFIYIWNNCSKIIITGSLKAYLITTVKHACINHLKTKARKNFTKYVSESDLNSLSGLYYQPIEANELRKHIKKAIQSLPDRCQTVFLLSRFTDMTYPQIAAELDISVKTVEAQMSIALSRIRKYIDDRGMLFYCFMI